MKKLTLSLLLLSFVLSSAAQAGLRIYGLYLAQSEQTSSGQRHYHDTMFANFTPSASFNGCTDTLLIRGWYSFGNKFDYPLIDDNVLDRGEKAHYVNKGTCGAAKIKCLDPDYYDLLNAVTGQEATANTGEGFIGAAGMRKVLVFNKGLLVEGTNRFTIVSPQANELRFSAMCGIFLHDGDTWSTSVMPAEGTPPNLCAVEQGAGTKDMEGASVPGAPAPRKDASYFQPCPCVMDHPTLSCVIGEYRVQITFFYLAGTNDGEVNPDGLTSPGAPSWVADAQVEGGSWSLNFDPQNEIAYLELYVTKASPQPLLATPAVIVPKSVNSGSLVLENLGAGSFSYTASETNSWLTLDSETTSGTVDLQKKVNFTVNRNGLEPGTYTAYVTFEIAGFGTEVAKVTLVVEPPATGAVRLAGLHIMGTTGDRPYYQDTMVKNLTPASTFDGGCMDILLAEGIYFFGNSSRVDVSPEASYLYAHGLDIGRPVQYETRGSFGGSNTVMRLNPSEYKLINNALDNLENPDCATLSEYIKRAGLVKQTLDYYLQVGTNRFTLILPEASEFATEDMQIGLFLGSPAAGEAPKLAATSNELFFDAIDSCYAVYTTQDWTYHYSIEPEDYYRNSTLKCQIGDYDLELTKFFLLGQNDSFANPYGLTSPATAGYVATGSDGSSAWAIHASPDTTLAYLEVVVDGIPEPSFLIFGLILLLALRPKK